mmetsp:Transcript_8700/g.20982  ORF Transcript_8700/g.20982 Transcript_8700/m.20982 type:complete len:231 (-) Transcript_8700:424-1116(-)
MYLSEISPFRTPEALARTHAFRVQALMRSARGLSVFTVDGKIWLFGGLHLTGLFALYCGNTDIAHATREALHFKLTTSVVGLLSLVTLAATTMLLYASVYASDPGWVSTNTQRGRCIQNYYCQHCGFSVPLRSRHCLQTGQCVHKFDHFCYLLSTSIGERPTRERRCYPGCHAFPMASCSWLQLSINAAIRPVSPWSTRLPWLQPLFPLGKLNPPSTRATALPFFSESRH